MSKTGDEKVPVEEETQLFDAELSGFDYSPELAIELFDNIPPMDQDWDDREALPFEVSPKVLIRTGFEIVEASYNPAQRIITKVKNRYGLVDSVQLIKYKIVLGLPDGNRVGRLKRAVVLAPDPHAVNAERLLGNRTIVLSEASEEYPDLLPAGIETGRFKELTDQAAAPFTFINLKENAEIKDLVGLTNLFLRIIEGKTVSHV